jgi:mannosyltransferase
MTTTGFVQRRPAHVQDRLAGQSSQRTPFDDLADWFARVPWCWSVLLTLMLGFYKLGSPELWRDEVASWMFAARPLPRLIAATHSSGGTQLPYYLLLHFWIAAFGDSSDAMRTLSVLAMAGAAACVTLIGRRIAGPRAGLISGLVFALVPSVSRFAQEVRFYALEVLVATLATLLLLRALDQPSWRRWAGYGACLAAVGYVDIVGLAVVTGHAVAVALRWQHNRDGGYLWFVPAASCGTAACLPLALIGTDQAGGQIGWILRPGLDLTVFSYFARNLFFSTSVAAALIVLAILAWAVAWREAAFVTAIAVVPVAAVWLASQGQHAYFFPRYLLLTVAVWAVLAGIGLSRIDVRVAAAAILAVAIMGAGDQQVLRTAGAHNWAYYPVGTGVGYFDYAGAADLIARQARPGDGIIYEQYHPYLLIYSGVQYYLERDMPRAVPVPRALFIARTPEQADRLYPVPCARPAACLGTERRIWVVESGRQKTLGGKDHLTRAEETLLARTYRVALVKHVPFLTVFQLVQRQQPEAARA